MTLAPRTWLYLACLWLSIATALGHAVAPVGSPLAPVAGSAFSASTTDVALAPARAAPLAQRATAVDGDQGTPFDDGPLLAPALIAPVPLARVTALPPLPALQPGPALPRLQPFYARAPPRG